MKKKSIFLVILLVLALLALGFWIWHVEFRPSKEKRFLQLYGNVDVRQVELGFRVFGRVGEMAFDEGAFVPKGAWMARLEKEPYQDQYNQAEAAERAAQATYENAELLLKRRQRLVQSGSVSKEDLENAESARNVDLANIQERQAAAAVARTNLQDTELFCPNDGIILTRVREPGTVVNVADPIYTLSVLSPVWIRAYVTETELGMIFPGMQAKILTDAQKTYDGHIGFISPVAEFTPKTVETEALRTTLVYRIRVIADNPDHFLKQGMPVTVVLDLEQTRDEPKN